MLTPLDIENKKFKKKPLGYSEIEVEEFLTEIITDYEKLYKENLEFKDKIAVLNDAIQHYKSIEDTLQNTLMVAQTTGEDIKKNANENAENIIKEAEMKASRIISEANHKVTQINCDYEEQKKQFYVFKKKLESMLNVQLNLLDDIVEKSEA